MRSHLYGVSARLISGLLAIALLAFPQQHAGASTIRFAKPAGLNSGSCSSWATACKLQRAIALAVSGDQVWVARGTHKPTPTTDPTKSFHLKSGVAIYGGFSGSETLLSQRNWRTNLTTLSGDLGVIGDIADNSYHVVYATGVSRSAVLDGFTIAAGNANGADPNNQGGGLYNNAGNPTLRNLKFIDNSAINGGGMANTNGSPMLVRVIFSSNDAGAGGGLYNYSYLSNPVLNNVVFAGNSASPSGGGMYSDSAAATLTSVTFSSNTASSGGGMYGIDIGVTPLRNVTFYGNSAANGGGIYIAESSPALTNVTFSGNTASTNGGAIYNTSTSGSPHLLDRPSVHRGDDDALERELGDPDGDPQRDPDERGEEGGARGDRERRADRVDDVRGERADHPSIPMMTLDALTRAQAWSPAANFRAFALSSVMTAVRTLPPARVTVTSALTGPSLIRVTEPQSTFRALVRAS